MRNSQPQPTAPEQNPRQSNVNPAQYYSRDAEDESMNSWKHTRSYEETDGLDKVSEPSSIYSK